MSKLRTLFLASRPVSWINTAYPFAAGYWVANGGIDWLWLVGTLYFLIPYNLLMYGVNDVFDYESDMRNQRKLGLEGIALDKRYHRLVLVTTVFLNLPFIIWLGFFGTAGASLVLAALMFTQLAYVLPVLRFKEKPFLDSLTSASHYVGPLVYAIMLAGWHPYYLVFILSFTLWAMASHAFGAVQDIIPDRQAGLTSIATFLSARWTVRLAVVLYLSAGQLLVLKGLSPAIVGGLSLLYVANIMPYWDLRNRASGKANAGWRRFIKLNYLSGAVITVLLIRSNL